MRKQITQDGKEPICYCCGKPIQKLQEPDKYADYLTISKTWGYFSSKDLTTHTFTLCEACYDHWVERFCIPIKEKHVEEIFGFEDEEE